MKIKSEHKQAEHVKLICQECYKEYEVIASRLKIGSKFCNWNCYQKANKKITKEDRFWKFVKKGDSEDACWFWTGFLRRRGYGSFQRGIAHRYSYELHYGPIPKGLMVCHKCDQPSCVNPSHLFLGDGFANMQDAARKGRMSKGENHCDAKLTDDKVRIIRQRWANGEKGTKLAREFNVCSSTIYYAVHGDNWKHVPQPTNMTIL